MPTRSRFLEDVARLDGSSVTEHDGRLRVAFADGSADELVALQPATADEWRSRLRRLEKQAAIVLLNPSLAYSIAYPARRGEKPPRQTLRLSASLSLSVGRPFGRRQVFTFSRGTGQVTVSEGEALPRRDGEQSTFLASLPGWVERAMIPLTSAIVAQCEAYELRPEVQDAVARIGEQRRTELAHIQLLYTSQRRGTRLYGLPRSGAHASSTVEAERRQLETIVLDRYLVQIRVRVLSLGILEYHA